MIYIIPRVKIKGIGTEKVIIICSCGPVDSVAGKILYDERKITHTKTLTNTEQPQGYSTKERYWCQQSPIEFERYTCSGTALRIAYRLEF
jgi:hypothetical protein